MKKLISYIMLAAASALFFACSPKSTPAITIEDAANAAPENTDIFLALEISKKLINEDLAQKGAKEFTTAFIENPEMQKFLDLAFQPLPEGLKSKISAKAVADFANEAMQKPEDIFFAMAATDLKEGCCDIKFIALNNSLCVKKIREILEQEKDIEKLRKGDIDFFKIKGETPAAVAVQNALLVVADDEAAAVKVIESLKSKKNGAFAATEKFRKLMSLEKDPIIVAAVNFKNISENSVGNMFFAYSAENANKGSGAAKFELGEKAFAGGNDAKIWGAFCKSKLEKASLLKNSMGNATFAMAAAVPEITAEIESEVLGDMIGGDPESQKIIASLKSAGLKSLCLSAGELDANTVINMMGENMQAPEVFLKIEAADADAIFKNEEIAQLINSPLFAAEKLGGDTVYKSAMYNLKIAQTGKTAAAISTIKDINQMMSLAKGKGKTLAGNKDAKSLVSALPEGNSYEIFMDIKALSDLSQAIKANVLGNEDQNFADKIDNISSKICKKAFLAMGVKLEPKEISISFKIDGEYDYELGVKLLKEMK